MNKQARHERFLGLIKERLENNASQRNARDGELFMFNIKKEKRDIYEKAFKDFGLNVRVEDDACTREGEELDYMLACYGDEDAEWRWDGAMVPRSPEKLY